MSSLDVCENRDCPVTRRVLEQSYRARKTKSDLACRSATGSFGSLSLPLWASNALRMRSRPMRWSDRPDADRTLISTSLKAKKRRMFVVISDEGRHNLLSDYGIEEFLG